MKNWCKLMMQSLEAQFFFQSIMHHKKNCLHLYVYRPQGSCGQGYVFTHVCHSVHRGGLRRTTPGPGRPPGPDRPPRPGRTPPGTKENSPGLGRTPQTKENPPDQGEPPRPGRIPPDQGEPPGPRRSPPRPGRPPRKNTAAYGQ